ncbi:MAG TPA: inositol monophosphatase family protein [Candidatus Krumholzibacteria bacterium]|nr:inositol monophosphatase family protein [Candidatus Krumholzibacteria bacterium]
MKFEKELEVAKAAAHKAGEIIMASYDRISEHDVDEKGRNDFVTVVDRESQDVILAAIRDAFPRDYVVAEETLPPGFNDGADPRRRWYIDPLDGTTNYIHAYPHFAVTIALEIDGDLSVAVTHSPVYRETYYAVRGEGAYLNGTRIHVSTAIVGGPLMLGTGFPFRARHLLEIYLKSFSFFFNHSRGLRRGGSAALDLAYVAAGRFDGFWELTLSPWDIAAGVLLVEEAGGRVNDFFGGRTFLESGHIVVTNGLIHDWMLDGVASVFPRDGDYSKRS